MANVSRNTKPWPGPLAVMTAVPSLLTVPSLILDHPANARAARRGAARLDEIAVAVKEGRGGLRRGAGSGAGPGSSTPRCGMKFKLDENLPGEGVQILRAAGHDAVTVLDQRLDTAVRGGRASFRCAARWRR